MNVCLRKSAWTRFAEVELAPALGVGALFQLFTALLPLPLTSQRQLGAHCPYRIGRSVQRLAPPVAQQAH